LSSFDCQSWLQSLIDCTAASSQRDIIIPWNRDSNRTDIGPVVRQRRHLLLLPHLRLLLRLVLHDVSEPLLVQSLGGLISNLYRVKSAVSRLFEFLDFWGSPSLRGRPYPLSRLPSGLIIISLEFPLSSHREQGSWGFLFFFSRLPTPSSSESNPWQWNRHSRSGLSLLRSGEDQLYSTQSSRAPWHPPTQSNLLLSLLNANWKERAPPLLLTGLFLCTPCSHSTQYKDICRNVYVFVFVLVLCFFDSFA
jgi:hypothetical protein